LGLRIDLVDEVGGSQEEKRNLAAEQPPDGDTDAQ
jgi:hypothetical protein